MSNHYLYVPLGCKLLMVRGLYQFGILSANHGAWHTAGTPYLLEEEMNKANFSGIMTPQQ